ncbi:ATP-dependent DNA helicase RecG [Bombiscardovia coagulans]|uniref:ATP-dependent DNA helicase RecG n=1 Tax=Bombiscardovia coagulans TaxID=686666 RepID=A0A261EUZ5_9BIFI|nr:ATP-dependent DNA helicase RecG [Bombiscardovia coagulans]OZG50684.1 ATP-dependent DNA helicase RecG [Bombiscardovia coagulans]
MSTGEGLSLQSTVSSLMTNKRRVSALKSLGIITIADALTYYPFRVTDPLPVRTISQITLGSPVACVARVEQMRVVSMGVRRGFRLEVSVEDSDFDTTGGMVARSAKLVFFSHRKSYIDWMNLRLQVGTTVVIGGEPSTFNDQLQFTHPEVLVVAPQVSDDQQHTVLSTSIRPDAESVAQALSKVSRPRPVYHANSRISSDHIHDTIVSIMRMLALAVEGHNLEASTQTIGESTDADQEPSQVIDSEAFAAAVPDIVPEKLRVSRGLLHRSQALLDMHTPNRVEDFRAAVNTLRFEEALVAQTALLRSKYQARDVTTYTCPEPKASSLSARFIDSLPFQLTQGQQVVIQQIYQDMARQYPMQRLLQGEVGSGKTVVALAAMLQAVDAGYQAVLVAPTQVLAEQHVESIGRMIQGLRLQTSTDKPSPVPLVLLTGGMRLAERRRVLSLIASGQPCIVVATHAAFSKTFQAPHLALVVIDEQHRFGVEQRETLRRKSEKSPHLLVMTATPIPRTAAMTWFGDLDISELTELPGGRKPIQTFIVPEVDSTTMGNMFWLIHQRVQAGERAYIVCPRISDGEDDAGQASSNTQRLATKAASNALQVPADDFIAMDPYAPQYVEDKDSQSQVPLHSVKEMSRRLSSLPQFQDIAIATLTGQDDDETKTQVMADFSSGKTPVLVATTVIEVGVDVPQASVVVVFDADRFGLSQLHQLRGRVGRGGTHSWAFMVSRADPDSLAASRLEVIRKSTDGAEIAQADIELRGAGDVLGDAQSGGRSSLKLLRVVTDAKLITDARQDAQTLLTSDPELGDEVQLAGAVLDFVRGNETFLTST